MSEQTHASHPIYQFLPDGNEGFGSLAELALDLRWPWNQAIDEMSRKLVPQLWEITHNDWVVLQTVSREQIERGLADPIFRKDVDGLVAPGRQAAKPPVWFQSCGRSPEPALPISAWNSF
jgi:starch phosphorylase